VAFTSPIAGPIRPTSVAVLRESLLAWRDRLLASPRFQRWAAGTPLTRGIAHRRARQLFDLCAGFVYSQVLAACVELRLFELLKDGSQAANSLAERLSLPLSSVERLMAAAVSLRLVERRSNGQFGLGQLGAALLGNPGVLAMIEHHRLLYSDLRDPVLLLRGAGDETALGHYWPYAQSAAPSISDTERFAPYTALMAASQQLIADDVLSAYPVAWHRCLLDVGGGDGTFLSAVASDAPRLDLQLFDLPAVARRARERQAEGTLARRVKIVEGDFLSDTLPAGADLITLVRVVHDHDDDAALRILRAVRDRLPRDGVLLIAEPMAGTAGAETVGDAYFNFYLLAMGSGKARTPEELTRLLRAAGFGRVEFPRMRRPLQTRLAVAHPRR
jgi:demethylspheroidene O-methyltransferase